MTKSSDTARSQLPSTALLSHRRPVVEQTLTIWYVKLIFLNSIFQIECARLLARDPRTSVNGEFHAGEMAQDFILVIASFSRKFVSSIVSHYFFSESQGGSYTALLIDMVRNPSFDINKLNKSFQWMMDNDELFDAVINNFDLDFSAKCSTRGESLLHTAVAQVCYFINQSSINYQSQFQNNLHAVGRLLEMMTREEISMKTRSGMTAYKRAMKIKLYKKPQLLRLFVDCPKVKFGLYFILSSPNDTL